MDHDERLARRAQSRDRRRASRRRAIGGLVVVAVVLVAAVAAVVVSRSRGSEPTPNGSAAPTTSGGDGVSASSPAPPAPPPPPAELPGGGRRLLPDRRLVAFVGGPQDPGLGALGVGSLDRAVGRLRRQAAAYARPGRPVLPVLELIAVVANADAGDDGLYRTQLPLATVRRYLAAARRADALLLLDVQPGRADIRREVARLAPILREPDVGLAIDPEWSVRSPDVPGQVIGSTTVAIVNEVSARLAAQVKAARLPEKLFVVHQFTLDMIRGAGAVARPPGVAVVFNVDGVGGQEIKQQKYRELTRPRPTLRHGFKLFYEEDTDLLSPRQVLALRPAPDLVIYE